MSVYSTLNCFHSVSRCRSQPIFATSCVIIFFLSIRLVTFLLPWQQEVTVYLLPSCARLHFLGDGDAGGCGEESNAGGRSTD